MTGTYSNIIKYPGNKWRIADWICSHMPTHHSYLEPYFGSGAVLFRKEPSPIETVNDLDSRVTNLFQLIRERPEDLARVISATPHSRKEYIATYTAGSTDDVLESTRQFLIQCWQGHGFRTSRYSSGWKNDVQGREAAYSLRNWYRLPVWIIEVAERLRQVQIENMPAVKLIQRFKYENVLIYADPPYVLGTRTGKQYKYEMTDMDHVELLQVLNNHPGPVLLSGYDSEIYNDFLENWSRTEIDARAEHSMPRKEILWINPIAAESLNLGLFEGVKV